MTPTVNERARMLATFRYIEVRLTEIVAGWTPITPEMEVKVVFGRHIWDFAQHADWLGKRTFEMRQPEHFTLPPASDYAALIEEVAGARTTGERLSLLYDFMLPALIGRYRHYLAATDELLDGPSVEIIMRIVEMLGRQISEGRAVRQKLSIPEVCADAFAEREHGLEVVAHR